MSNALKNNEHSTQTAIHVFRLLPHQDLKKSILEFAKANNIKAASVVTCVGSLEQTNLRFANQKEGMERKGYHEILSLSGTLSDTSVHLHLTVANSEGTTTGGHLLDGNLIYTTAELVIMELTDIEFVREIDPTYGYHELKIKKITPT
jgi:predicted DNA-binding protein with PD1-like motif